MNEPELDPQVQAALFNVETLHQFHGDDCTCGFSSAVARLRTEHLTRRAAQAVTEVIRAQERVRIATAIRAERRKQVRISVAPHQWSRWERATSSAFSMAEGIARTNPDQEQS